MRCYLGLDLGKQSDPTALAILRAAPPRPLEKADPKARPPGRSYDCVHLHRFPLGTTYPAIVQAVADLIARREVQPSPVLVVDATGVGQPVCDLFRAKRMPCRLVAATITGGFTPRIEGLNVWVPKLVLVSTIQALLSTGRLKVVPTLREAATLRRELLNFQVKISAAANEQFGQWREGEHDDTVLAVALAAWVAEHAAGGIRPASGGPPLPTLAPPGGDGMRLHPPGGPSYRW